MRILKGRLRAAAEKQAVGSALPLRYDLDEGKFYPAERCGDDCPFSPDPPHDNEDF